jgi:riboflavin synthase
VIRSTGTWFTGTSTASGAFARSAAGLGDARSLRLTVDVPEALRRYLAVKGSVAIDGVSLTINEVDSGGFSVNIIPHTRDMTIIAGYAAGTTVNIEVDMMARYLERLGSYVARGEESGVDTEMLQEHGFAGHE